ncbi:MAG: N-6 DNA methylase [Planctomycetia bacterium]|nr:N-6 DNA methylase [Planctomycetia bacterium]
MNCKNYPKILDPSCGSGVFFLSMIRHWKEKKLSWKDILTLFVGLELNPVSVLMARVNILLELFRDFSIQKRQNAINDLADQYNKTLKPIVPIYLFDTIRNVFLQKEDQSSNFVKDNDFDIILGNPPWLNWDQLSAADRNATKPLWIQYGLFNLSGKEARYGGGKKELAALILYLSADRYLKKDGFLAMVLPQALFQTPKAGEGFRRFLLPGSQEGDFSYLKLIEINDFSKTNPFPDVNSKVATLLLQKSDKPTEFPIPYFISKKATPLREKKWAEPIDQNRKGSPLKISNQKKNPDFFSSSPNIPNCHINPTDSTVTKNIYQSSCSTEKNYCGQKVDPINQDNSNSLNFPNNETASINLTKSSNSDNLGHSGKIDHSYRAQLGANTAGANGVYWLEILEQTSQSLIKVQNCFDVGKKKVELNQAELESELIYPLLRWKDVDEFYADPSSFILIPQDSKTRKGICFERMKEKFPRSLQFLSNYETILKSRAAYQKFQARAVYWSMYNINPLTFAPIKVVWRRMDKILRAAVITTDIFLRKPIIPQETISMIAVESLAEAHYLTAMLNSNEIRNKVESFSVIGSKGFGSPGILSLLAIPRFDPSNHSHLILSQSGQLKWEQKRTAK